MQEVPPWWARPLAEAMVRMLQLHGVKHIFGLCGHTNIAVLAALSRSRRIGFVNTRHEQVAAHMAEPRWVRRFTEHGLRALFSAFEIVELTGTPTPGRPLMPVQYQLVARRPD